MHGVRLSLPFFLILVRNLPSLISREHFYFFCLFFVAGDNFGACSNFNARLSLQPKLSRASLISDEAPTEYRRKSAGSPNATAYNTPGFGSITNTAEPYIYAFDECERHPDGTVVLR